MYNTYMCIYMYIHTRSFAYICMYICIRIYMCSFRYVHTYMCIFTYIYEHYQYNEIYFYIDIHAQTGKHI